MTAAPAGVRRWWAAVQPSVVGERVVTQLVAVGVGAVLAGVAALLYSDASGSWQQAVREETRRDAALQEQVRTVYGDEAAVAYRVAVADVRARALRPIADTSRVAGSEHTVAAQLAFQLRRSAPPGSLAADRRYELPEGGFDVPRRLADLMRSGAGSPDPDVTTAEGNAQALRAGAVAGFAVIVTGVASAAAAMPRRRAPGGRGAERDPQLIPQPGLAAPAERRAATLLLVAWAAGVLLPLVQLALSGEEQRSQAATARTAVQLSGETAVSLTRSGFETNARRDAAFTNVSATSRELAALDAPDAQAAAERTLADREETAAALDHDIAATMGRLPAEVDGLDPRTVAALRSEKNDWEALGARQNAEAARADFYGAWSNAAVVAIAGVIALTALVQVATMASRRPDASGKGA